MTILGSRFGAVALLGLLLSLGCGGDDDANSQASSGMTGLKGDIKIDGSSTVYPISMAVATNFRETYPDVNVTVGFSGTGGGFEKFHQGETDISNASRPIKSGEFNACTEAGVAFVEIPVAYDGLTIVVNPQNDWVTELTVEDLAKIFRSDLACKTWKEVNDRWPDEEIAIFAPGTQSGTFDYFCEVIVPKDAENIKIRADMNASEDDNEIVTGVAGSKYSIGFFGVAYYVENKEKVRAVPIINPNTNAAVLPEAANIESGEYAPFSRPLFIYVKVDALKKTEVLTFVEFYLDHAADMAAGAGYVALPLDVYDSARQHLDDRIAGCHFLDKDGQKRSGPVTDLYTVDSAVGFE